MKTYDSSYALNAGKKVLEVPPTSASWLNPNNAGQSGSKIWISTNPPFDHTVLGTGDTFISINHGQLRYHSVDFHHSGQIDYAWISSACVLLLLVLIVGVALRRDSHPRNLQSEPVLNASASLESRETVKCLVPRVQTTYPPTFPSRGLIEAGPPTPIAAPTPLEKSHQDLSPGSPAEVPQNTGLVDPSKGLGTVDQTVALKEQHRIVAWITLLFVEGFLSLEPSSTSAYCGDVV
ncbi:hypothetical protein FRC01_007485, partial [Tulasnella sp. 417]